jgi:hypothetical protein
VGVKTASIVATAVCAAGCGSSQLDAPETRGLSAPSAEACERNFYADEVVCYPTTNVGTRFRSGDIPGERIANTKLLGYEALDPNVAMTKPPGPVTVVPLSDFYDPESRRSKMLMIAALDASSIAQSQMIAMWAQALAQRGVSIIEVLQRSQNAPASLSDLTTWIDTTHPDVSVVVDGVQFFELVPHDGPMFVFVDARSMELLGTEQDYDPTFTAAQNWITWIDAHPPLSSP